MAEGPRLSGLDLAQALHQRLRGALGWEEQHVYIDAVNLTQSTPGAYPKRDGAGLVVRNPQGEEVWLNHHWAEYYSMGALLARTVVLILDQAWLESVWCEGEGKLFLANFA